MHAREFATLLAAVAVVTACGRKEPPEQPAPEPIMEETRAPEPAPAPAAAPAPDNSALLRQRATLEERIHFAFNSAELSAEAQQRLASKAAILTADQSIRIRIEGHADERGADEYNLALGTRRANAAMRFLILRGVPQSRLETVSYGEERPLQQGSGESVWAMNRRGELQVTSGISSR
jgi:peptidoglycan-associated lipoprotein